MKALYDVPAPAKINAFLHVLGQRADGYHLLQSAMILIDWCDNLCFEVRRDGVISRSNNAQSTNLPEQDLSVRAAQALQRVTGCQLGVQIELTKKIPIQAGLGGGSSDAASTLIALNYLWQTKLTKGQLAELAVELGADVPFFICGKNAWVEGVGEIITPINVPKSCEAT
jgi:4-diphosphocytidyl-2-C-methyl-D-erythritol kinase